MHVTFCGWPGERNFPDNLKTYYSKRNANRCRPAELLMNRRLRTRLDILRPEIQKRVAKPAKLQPTVPKIQGVWEILLLYKITGSVKIPGSKVLYFNVRSTDLLCTGEGGDAVRRYTD